MRVSQPFKEWAYEITYSSSYCADTDNFQDWPICKITVSTVNRDLDVEFNEARADDALTSLINNGITPKAKYHVHQ